MIPVDREEEDMVIMIVMLERKTETDLVMKMGTY